MIEMVTKNLIERIVQSNPDKDVVKKFATLCHQIAVIYVKKKISSGLLSMHKVQLTIEDFSWDCIAELFEMDERRNFVELQKYFYRYEIDDLKREELVSTLRRLVFSKVNDGIFRNFRTIDPSLGKIIRNVKRVAKEEGSFSIIRHRDISMIQFGNDEYECNPQMPFEFLKIKLFAQSRGNENISQIMDHLLKIFKCQNNYSRRYSIVNLARAIRYLYAKLGEREVAVDKQVDDTSKSLMHSEMSDFIQRSIRQLKDRMYPKYVETSKLDEHIFKIYFKSIEDILKDAFINPGKDESYFYHLKMNLGCISKEEYRNTHRQYLEYLVKLVRNDLLMEMREEI